MESTKRKKVIAICADGHGAGKTTLAGFIQDYYMTKNDGAAVVLSFVEILKAAASDLIGYKAAYDEKDKPLEKLNGKTVRDLLIFMGEGIKKEFGQDFFVKNTIVNDIEDSTYDLYIIDDLRFPVELDTLRDKYGDDLIVIYVHSPAAQKCDCEGLINSYQSDWETWNTGTLGNLYDEATEIVERLVFNHE